MFGQHSGRQSEDSTLPIYVQTVVSAAAFALAKKAWEANHRGVRTDSGTQKEFLRFELVEQQQVVWLQRDQGRMDSFELIIVWGHGERFADVYVVTSGPAEIGNAAHITELFEGLLTLPATVPVKDEGGS